MKTLSRSVAVLSYGNCSNRITTHRHIPFRWPCRLRASQQIRSSQGLCRCFIFHDTNFQVVMLGAVFSSACFLLSTFFTHVAVFLATYSIGGGGEKRSEYEFHFLLSGLGFGLIYLPSIVVVGQYFESKRYKTRWSGGNLVF